MFVTAKFFADDLKVIYAEVLTKLSTRPVPRARISAELSACQRR